MLGGQKRQPRGASMLSGLNAPGGVRAASIPEGHRDKGIRYLRANSPHRWHRQRRAAIGASG